MSEDLTIPSVAQPVASASEFHSAFHTSRKASGVLWELLAGRPVVVLDVEGWTLNGAPEERDHYGIVAEVLTETDGAVLVGRGTSARKAVSLAERADEKRTHLVEAQFQAREDNPDALRDVIARLEERALARDAEYGIEVPLEERWVPKSGIKSAFVCAAHVTDGAGSDRATARDATDGSETKNSQTGLTDTGRN